jgi:hypothetical protein
MKVVSRLVMDWTTRVSSQEDYNALVDWANFRVPNEVGALSMSEVFDIVRKRPTFPDMGQRRWDWSQLARELVADHPVELAQLILDLMEGEQVMVLAHSPESEVLVEAVSTEPRAVWDAVAERLLAGSWRVEIEIRSWFLLTLPLEVLEQWVGDDVHRARIVASVAPAGAGTPTPVARFLLGNFPGDDEIRSSLWGEFMSGTYVGPESMRLENQIAHLRTWESDTDEPEGVRHWAAEMVRYLEARREQALRDEAERAY